MTNARKFLRTVHIIHLKPLTLTLLCYQSLHDQNTNTELYYNCRKAVRGNTGQTEAAGGSIVQEGTVEDQSRQ